MMVIVRLNGGQLMIYGYLMINEGLRNDGK